jgi:hypothetical protein
LEFCIGTGRISQSGRSGLKKEWMRTMSKYDSTSAKANKKPVILIKELQAKLSGPEGPALWF